MRSPTMEAVLSQGLLLEEILSRLSLKQLLVSRLVCQEWKTRVENLLKNQRNLAIISRTDAFDNPEYIPYVRHGICKRHPVSKYDLLYLSIDMWKSVVQLIPGIEVVYYYIADDLEHSRKVLNLLMETYSSSLKCLSVNSTCATYLSGSLFKCGLLPRLEDYKSVVGDSSFELVCVNSPNLKYFEGWSWYDEWNLLPRGFQVLKGTVGMRPQGFKNLVSSPAVSTIREIDHVISFSPDTHHTNFNFCSLKTLKVKLSNVTTQVLQNLGQFIRSCPVLTKLSVVITIHDSSFDHETWLTVLADCRSITDLHLDFNHFYSCGFMTQTKWADKLVGDVAGTLKNLKGLELGFNPSADGFTSLSFLERLEHFQHKLERKSMADDNSFNENAILLFLRTAFSKKLVSYSMLKTSRIEIPFTNSFIEQLKIMSLETGLTFLDNDKETAAYVDTVSMNYRGNDD